MSCERVFNPAVRNKPVIVFSNNDGCAVAISNEAKAIGVKRGDPFFKIKDICETNDIAIFSGNHKLYGDMSSRVMATLASIVPEIDIYSVDEAFLHMDKFKPEELNDVGRNIVRQVRRVTGIPTSLGIAPTRTLAKIAAVFAKKYPGYHSCCVIDNEEKRRKALALTPIREVWGIGRRMARRLISDKVTTALQLADWPQETVEHVFNITGKKTWLELNGVPCMDFEPDESPQKQMLCSRSFSQPLTTFSELAGVISSFANIVGRKLRERSLCANSISVFIQSDRFRANPTTSYATDYRTINEPTADTLTITSVAIDILRSIFRPDHAYKRAGIVLNELIENHTVQQSLFSMPGEREKRSRLMATIDKINRGSWGKDAVHTGAYSPIDEFVRHENPSRLFSTRLSDIITINCNYGL